MCNACFCSVRAFLIREATTKPSATTARLCKRSRRRSRRLLEGLFGSVRSHDRVFRSAGSILIGRQHPEPANPPLIMTAIRYRLTCRSRACEIQKSQWGKFHGRRETFLRHRCRRYSATLFNPARFITLHLFFKRSAENKSADTGNFNLKSNYRDILISLRGMTRN